MIDTKQLAALADAVGEEWFSGPCANAVDEYLAAVKPAAIKELCQRVERAEASAANWSGTALQYLESVRYYSGLIDAVAPVLGASMCTQDDGGVVPDSLRACLPDAVEKLASERDQLKADLAEAYRALMYPQHDAIGGSSSPIEINKHQPCLDKARAFVEGK